MTFEVESGVFVKALSAALALTKEEEVFFTTQSNGYLVFFTPFYFFKVVCQTTEEVTPKYWSVPTSFLKPISTLKASVVDENIKLDFSAEELVISSNISFVLPCKEKAIVNFLEFETRVTIYQEPDVLKNLSKALSKMSKDNYKGSFVCLEDCICVPGTHQCTYIMTEVHRDERSYALKSAQLNKLLKLGQDIAIIEEGLMVSDGDVPFSVKFHKLKETSPAAKKQDLEANFTDALPSFTILQPKIFKDFLKNAKSDDKQYDLCRIQTEENRITIAFYKDKTPSNKFVYTNVRVPDSSFEIYLQTKHLMALAELGTEEIKVTFSSTFEPLKVEVDDIFTVYLMQGIVV